MDITSFKALFWRELMVSFEQQAQNTLSSHIPSTLRSRLKLTAFYILGVRFFHIWLLSNRNANLKYFISNLQYIFLFYIWLSDDESKSLMIKLVVRKILGFHHLAAIVEPDDERLKIEQAKTLITKENISTIYMGQMEFGISTFDLSALNYPIKANIHEMNVVYTFISEQYRFQRDNVDIKVEEGDTCIDAGGCWGDTALYFAAKSRGRVYSFEFVQQNLQILRSNLSQNPLLTKYISVVENPLWDESDIKLFFHLDRGPGTNVSEDIGAKTESSNTITIDDFVKLNEITKVDFIKMDIEGAELKALMGAKETIKQFAPKLAITVYHRQEDFCTIPHYLKYLVPEYKFYLDHFTSSSLETVLFATV